MVMPAEGTTASGLTWKHWQSPSKELAIRFTNGKTEFRPIYVEVKRIVRERGHWPTAEVVVNVEPPGNDSRHDIEAKRVYRGRLSLLSTSQKRDCIKACSTGWPDYAPTWAEIVEAFTDEALSKMSGRVAPVMLGNGPVELERPKYQVAPILQHHQANLLWGNSDIGKSWLAVYLCALVDNGIAVNGLDADPGKSLYVDYETTPDAMAERVRAGLRGQIPDTWEMPYLSSTGLLTESIADLSTYVSDNEEVTSIGV